MVLLDGVGDFTSGVTYLVAVGEGNVVRDGVAICVSEIWVVDDADNVKDGSDFVLEIRDAVSVTVMRDIVFEDVSEALD